MIYLTAGRRGDDGTTAFEWNRARGEQCPENKNSDIGSATYKSVHCSGLTHQTHHFPANEKRIQLPTTVQTKQHRVHLIKIRTQIGQFYYCICHSRKNNQRIDTNYQSQASVCRLSVRFATYAKSCNFKYFFFAHYRTTSYSYEWFHRHERILWRLYHSNPISHLYHCNRIIAYLSPQYCCFHHMFVRLKNECPISTVEKKMRCYDEITLMNFGIDGNTRLSRAISFLLTKNNNKTRCFRLS